MQAIRTRYHGATDSKGSRISAKCEAGTIYVSWDHGLDVQQNHVAAATAMRNKMKWDTDHYPRMASGVFGGDYYHVFVS